MPREGEVDPWSGQRAAFPLEDDSPESVRAIEYLQRTREEAQRLAVNSISLKRPRREVMRLLPETNALDYSSPEIALSDIISLTNELFAGEQRAEIGLRGRHRVNGSNDKLTELYYEAYEAFKDLDPQHPEECTSLATWKTWTMQNWPVPVNHVDTFRLYKYLSKWCAAQPPRLHFIWAWSLLLRTPDVVSADEISMLRDLSRSLQKHASSEPLASAFIQVVAKAFGQADLL